MSIYYKKEYQKMVHENVKKVSKEIDGIDMQKKIANYAKKFGYTKEDVRSKILSDKMFANQFAKDPARQSFHENLAYEYITTFKGVQESQKLPKSGQKAFYANNGSITNNNTNNTKSIDFFIKTSKHKIWILHKYTNEPGGMQDNQFRDACVFIQEASKGIEDNENLFIAVLDGDYYTKSKFVKINKYIKKSNIYVCNINELKDMIENGEI